MFHVMCVAINPGFALDQMEPLRSVVDRAVLQLIDTMTFTGGLLDSARRSLPHESRASAKVGAPRIGAVRGQ